MDLLEIGKKQQKLEDMMQRGAVIVDVRSTGEFASGHVKGSINVPLDSIQHKVSKLKKLNKPLILCCASGMRSASATAMLKGQGMEVMNGGSWRSLA